MKPDLSQPDHDPVVLDDHENPRQWPAAKKCTQLPYTYLTV